MTKLGLRFDPVPELGRLVERRNRFLAHVSVGSELRLAHVPSSGRLRELLLPGAQVLVQPAAASPSRRTQHTLIGARHVRPQGDAWVCVHTGIANRLAGLILRNRLLPGFESFGSVRAEVADGESRLDFRVEGAEGEVGWVEVKCVTLAEGDEARFPDAPTTRGVRHLQHLAALARGGQRAAVLFVVQRDDVDAFAPNCEQDPAFAESLFVAAADGVSVHAVAAAVSPKGIEVVRSLPVRLCPRPHGLKLRTVST